MSIFERLFGFLFGESDEKQQEKNEQTRRYICDTLTDMKTRCNLLEADIQRTIIQIRQNIRLPHSSLSEKNRLMMRLRLLLGQYWYLRKMVENVEILYDQQELMRLTKDFGKVVSEMNDLTKSFGVEKIDFEKLTKQFVRSLRPMKNQFGDQFNRMNEALIKVCQESTGAQNYSDDFLEKVIAGTETWGTPPMDNNNTSVSNPARDYPPPAQPNNPEPSAAADDPLISQLAEMIKVLKG